MQTPLSRAIKVALGFAALLIFGIAPALAQPGNLDPAQMRQRAVEGVNATITALSIEGDKAEAVRTILMARTEKRFEMMSALRESGGGRAGMRDAMTALNEETEQQLAAVLTQEELGKWKKHEEENAPGRRRRGGS